jgi:hypothetical protein
LLPVSCKQSEPRFKGSRPTSSAACTATPCELGTPCGPPRNTGGPGVSARTVEPRSHMTSRQECSSNTSRTRHQCASSTAARLVEYHRVTTSVAAHPGRPSFGYFSWPRKKSNQPRVCHPEKSHQLPGCPRGKILLVNSRTRELDDLLPLHQLGLEVIGKLRGGGADGLHALPRETFLHVAGVENRD